MSSGQFIARFTQAVNVGKQSIQSFFVRLIGCPRSASNLRRRVIAGLFRSSVTSFQSVSRLVFVMPSIAVCQGYSQ